MREDLKRSFVPRDPERALRLRLKTRLKQLRPGVNTDGLSDDQLLARFTEAVAAEHASRHTPGNQEEIGRHVIRGGGSFDEIVR